MNLGENLIFYDYRETKSTIPSLLNKWGLKTQKLNMSIDYQIGNLSIERKTIADFTASILDKRMFRQIGALSNNYQSLLVLEGGGLYKQGSLSPNIIRGVIIWITIVQRVSLIRTYDHYDTACLLKLLSKQFVTRHNKKITFTAKKSISKWNQEMKIISQIPGIGWKTAKNILNKFGSLSNFLDSSDKKILELDNMGVTRLKRVREIFPPGSQKI
jgi:Fanconi anemia group M protein